MDHADVRDEEVLILRQCMLEGVVHDAEAVAEVQALDRRGGLALELHRAVGEPDRLEEGDHIGACEHRRDLGHHGAERGGPRVCVGIAEVDPRNEADGLGAGGIGRLDQGGDRGAPLGVPVVEGVDLAQSDEAQAALARHLARAVGRDAVEERAAEVVAGLDADAAEVGGEIEEGGEVEPRRRLLVQGEVHGVSFVPGRSGVALHDPLDLGCGDEAPLAQRPGHDVEVVHLEAVGRAAGVVAAGDEGDVAVGDGHRLVERAVVGVDALDAEAVRRVQAVVVGLLEIGDPRVVVLVVAVARDRTTSGRRG